MFIASRAKAGDKISRLIFVDGVEKVHPQILLADPIMVTVQRQLDRGLTTLRNWVAPVMVQHPDTKEIYFRDEELLSLGNTISRNSTIVGFDVDEDGEALDLDALELIRARARAKSLSERQAATLD